MGQEGGGQQAALSRWAVRPLGHTGVTLESLILERILEPVTLYIYTLYTLAGECICQCECAPMYAVLYCTLHTLYTLHTLHTLHAHTTYTTHSTIHWSILSPSHTLYTD